MEYAVKIGEVHLRSKTPITEQERVEAVHLLLKNSQVVAHIGPKE